MKASDRIKEVLLEFHIDSAEELSRQIGVDGDLIRNVLNGRTLKMSGKVADGISKVYPVNYAWLMTGEGEMGKTNQVLDEVTDEKCKNCYIVQNLKEIIEAQRQLIKDLSDLKKK